MGTGGVLLQDALVVLRQLKGEQLERAFFVGVLAAFAFNAHGDAAGEVYGAYGGFGFVYMLAAFATGAAGLKLNAVVVGQLGDFR